MELEPDLRLIIKGGTTMNKMYKCPKCGETNTADFWDETTRKVMGIQQTDTFMSLTASKEDHAEVESTFNCPICNEEIRGIDVIKAD